jgi:ribosomal-protein-alanine N-acetyltransferase
MSTTEQSALVYEALREELLGHILAIETEAYPEPWTAGMFRDEMRSNRSYFRVAYTKDRLIGYSGFWLVGDEAHITSVTVDKEYRGKGYGREQLMHLLEIAAARGARIATLEVRESNKAARSLYDSIGFRSVGLRRGYYSKTNEDAIVMLKDLVSS